MFISVHLFPLYQKLPKVNKELALKLIEEEEEKQKSTLKKKVKVRCPKASVSCFVFTWVLLPNNVYLFIVGVPLPLLLRENVLSVESLENGGGGCQVESCPL